MRRINILSPQSGRILISGEQVGGDLVFAFGNSSEANTQRALAVAVPQEATAPNDALQAYKLAVHNPSAVSALTLKMFTVEKSLGGADRFCLLETLDVPKAQTIKGTAIDAYEYLVGGIFCGGDLKIVASNDTALGAAEGFTATIRIREV